MSRILICGRSRVAEQTIKELHKSDEFKVVGYVVPRNTSFARDSIKVARELSIPIFNHHVDGNYNSKPDIILSIYYDRIFTKNDISSSPLILNIHNSILPKYRGMRPIEFAMQNMDKQIGVSIHKIEEGIDTGPIYSQETFIVDENETIMSAREKCFDLAVKILMETLPNISRIEPLIQNPSLATYNSKDDIWKLDI